MAGRGAGVEDEMARDVAAERAQIEEVIAGRTLVDVFRDTVAKLGDDNALSWRTADGWQHLSWNQYRDQVRDVSLGLRKLGMKPGDFVVIQARNRPEHLIADLAVIHAGGTPVSLYNTLAPEQIQYITSHCEATYAIVEDAGFLARFHAVRRELPKVQAMIMMEPDDALGHLTSWDDLRRMGAEEHERDPEAFERNAAAVKPDDLATLIYTSGTTGPPKGVMDSHHQVLWMCESTMTWLPRPAGSRHLSYLPFAHAFERHVGHWYGLYFGADTYFCPDPANLFAYAAEIKPNDMIGVPRVWEKLHSALNAGIGAEPDEARRAGTQGAIAVGRELVRHRQAGTEPPAELAAKAEACRPVWRALLGKVGLDECEVAITGAAPISVEVIEFFQALELPLVEGWGMTETTVGATFAPDLTRPRNGTVGMADFGCEVMLADDGEILVRGGNVAQGYYKQPDATAETFDADGWLHTGDIGTIDDDGYVSIIDRKKELIITAGGKNISPANLENLLKQHPLVGQACAIGDRRPYVSALVVLDAEAAPGWAKAHGVEYSSLADLAARPEVLAAVQEAVDDCNTHVAQVESIRRFTILPVEWTAESDELTPTLKLKRRVVHERYAGEIEAMYATAKPEEVREPQPV
ncbi:MAG: long-chain acyl-CoA synthetase [Chloroflexota bacterium]|jgi:long-chain acyl-CoA synthetase|nr:long-chain acyl-CoA synthetase [Chloroflexota bacterium]